MRVDVALTPSEAAAFPAGAAVVVVDALRATTTIATLFAAGAASVLAVATESLARARAAQEGLLLFGEVEGLPPPGFDHGNSPVEAAAAAVAGRGVVLFTTNGTKALCAVAEAAEVVAGSFANAGAAAAHLAGRDRVLIVCAGNGGGIRFSLEDFAAAGAIARRLAAAQPVVLGDGARLAAAQPAVLGDGARLAAATSPELARGSDHAQALRALGLDHDVDFSLREDTSAAVPAVRARGEGWVLLRPAV